VTDVPVSEPKPRRRKAAAVSEVTSSDVDVSAGTELHEATESPHEAPHSAAPTASEVRPAPSTPAADARVKVRVLRNYLHDGKRLRVKGEIITLTERQVATLGSAVERV
jgi:hypothetical protein